MTLTETLIQLIDIGSVTGDEKELTDHLAARWAGRPVSRHGNNLVVGAAGDRPLVLLVGHLDTVPFQGQPPAHIADGRVNGVGASDMKSGLAVMAQLLDDPEVARGPYDVVGVFYDREEGPAADNGLEPTLDAFPWLAEADFAVVMEPTDLELQLGCQGVLNATVTFSGRSAHSARPWLGENAVTKAGEWLAMLHHQAPEPFTVSGLEYLEVFSVTTAHGGIARNVIPPSFEINLNHRFPPCFTLEEAEQRLREIAGPADEVVVLDRAPAAPVPEGNPLLDRMERATGAPRTPKQAWTDVARLTARGIPAVNYGPGEVAQAHQATESVAASNLDLAMAAMKRFLGAG